jgi:hypothetical protein
MRRTSVSGRWTAGARDLAGVRVKPLPGSGSEAAAADGTTADTVGAGTRGALPPSYTAACRVPSSHDAAAETVTSLAESWWWHSLAAAGA